MTNRCPVRATALAYTTLLALIPMLAVVASVTTTLLKTQGKERINNAVEVLVAQVLPDIKEEPPEGATTNETDGASVERSVETQESAEPGDNEADSGPKIEISDETKQMAAEEFRKNKETIVSAINDYGS